MYIYKLHRFKTCYLCHNKFDYFAFISQYVKKNWLIYFWVYTLVNK